MLFCQGFFKKCSKNVFCLPHIYCFWNFHTFLLKPCCKFTWWAKRTFWNSSAFLTYISFGRVKTTWKTNCCHFRFTQVSDGERTVVDLCFETMGLTVNLWDGTTSSEERLKLNIRGRFHIPTAEEFGRNQVIVRGNLLCFNFNVKFQARYHLKGSLALLVAKTEPGQEKLTVLWRQLVKAGNSSWIIAIQDKLYRYLYDVTSWFNLNNIT